ncbi:DDE-1 domain-containing protein [Mycena venus]|uniref:DDE-1 domain-containing protein n=1 Tax=Mycena venus TaxID=2733690 RepID=A0A8H6X445_9AGAR|nr:DDE-1 domain-containing protein [Mycena venus]
MLSAEHKELLQIPDNVLKKIFPSSGACVRDFLAHKLPGERTSSFFIHPDTLDFDPICLQTPPVSVIRALANAIADSKVPSGTCSIACPHLPGNRNTYPLYLLSFWAELLSLRTIRQSWLSTETLEKIQVLPWDSRLRGFTNRNTLADLSSYCNRSWLHAPHIDQMLELLEAEGLNLEDNGIRVLPCDHAERIMDLYGNKTESYLFDPQYLDLRNLGAEFATGGHKKLCTIANIHNDHWVALVINFVAETVHYGDSFGEGFNASLRGAYDWWIEQHTDKKFTWVRMPITPQTDGHSCGILALNSLAHYLDANRFPLLNMAEVANERLRVLSKTIDQHNSIRFNNVSKGFTFSFSYDLAENVVEIIKPTTQLQTESRETNPPSSTTKAPHVFKSGDTGPLESPPLTSSLSRTEPPSPRPSTPPASAPDLSFYSPMKGKVKRGPTDRAVSSPPPSPVKKRPAVDKEKRVAASTRGLREIAGGQEPTGLLKYMKKETAEQREARVQKEQELREEHAEKRGEEEFQKARDVVVRADEKRVGAAAGIRNSDFTLKKRLKVYPNLMDTGVTLNMPELTRPAPAIEKAFKEKHRTHNSGRKPTAKSKPKVKHNWKNPAYFAQIDLAARITSDCNGLSVTRIVNYLQVHDYKTFHSLAISTLQYWVETKDGVRRWKEDLLEDVKTKGYRPGHCKGGRRGILVNSVSFSSSSLLYKVKAAHPDVLVHIVEALASLRKSGAPLSLISVRAIIVAKIYKFAPEIFERKFADGSTFRVSDSFCRSFLHTTMQWSERTRTNASQKKPKDWEDKCEQSELRRAYTIKREDIPPELIVNTDQTGIVFNPGGKFTWAPRGSTQVTIIGQDEKRAFTAELFSLVLQAFSLCVVREWNLSYESLTSPAIRARLRKEREDNTTSLPPEDEMPRIELGEDDGIDDSDISPKTLIADILGKKPRKSCRVVEKNQGRLSSAADAENADDIEGDFEVGSSSKDAEEVGEKAETSGRSKRNRKPNTLYTGWRRHFDEDDSEDEGEA